MAGPNVTFTATPFEGPGVASGHALAAAAGADVLAAGGNAADAALAAAFTQWVVNAPQSGPGGELLALVCDGDDVTVIGGWSRTPTNIAAPDEWSPALGGPDKAVVPGALRGAQALWERYGTLGWGDLFAGALDAAAGHAVTPRMERVFEAVQRKGHGAALRGVFGLDGPPVEGQTIVAEDLGRTLQLIADEGADAFYAGELADRLVAAAKRDGAGLRHRDLEAVEAQVTPARRFELDDVELWLPGPPSQAAIVATLLGFVAPDTDPASHRFADAVAPLVEQQLVKFCTTGLDGTAASTAVDGQGMSVTVVHSLAGVQFGTGWVAEGTGVAFGNRLATALSTRRDLPAVNPRAGAVLPHTLSAVHVRRHHAGAGSASWMTAATPGGDRQVQWLAQCVQRFRQGVPRRATRGGASLVRVP